MGNADPIVEPIDIETPSRAAILDVRDGEAFRPAHVRGAVRVPIERWEAAAKAPDTSLANVAHWEAAIGALGISGENLVLIYDDGRMTEAARVWFILQHFGVAARVVNGGWPALQSAFPQWAEPGDVPPPASVAYKARLGSHSVGLVDRAGMKARLGPGTRIFDARTAAEFSGEDLRKNARGGHLPGAVLLAHRDLLDGNGRMRPANELHDILAGAGFKSGDRIVTHCDGGGRAALAAIAAVRAGYRDVDAYYLSFSDWAKDESCPIVRD